MGRPKRKSKGKSDKIKVRTDHQIRVPEVRVIDPEGKQVGIVPTRQAITMAQDHGLSLIEISPTAKPPVCRIMDYGKYMYDLKKKRSEQKKKQVVILVKEAQFRIKTDVHDFTTKMNQIIRFLSEGHKAKISIIFRGREMAHVDIGREQMNKILGILEEAVVVDVPAKMEGRRMTMLVSPKPGVKIPYPDHLTDKITKLSGENAS